MSSLRLALITDVPLGEEAVLSMLGEKNPLSLVKGLGVGVSAVGKVINLYKNCESTEIIILKNEQIFCRDYCIT